MADYVSELRKVAVRESRTYGPPEDHVCWRVADIIAGFTREDVDALRNLCADLHPYCQPFFSIADRIATLLPPEPTDG